MEKFAMRGSPIIVELIEKLIRKQVTKVIHIQGFATPFSAVPGTGCARGSRRGRAIQAWVDRRFYRRKCNAEQVLAARRRA